MAISNIRFAAKPTNGPQVPHQRDEFYFGAAGTAHYQVEDMITAIGPGDLLFTVCRWDCRRYGEVR
jgi:mannose-6-phosphate isomerase-like protein (cupin superfamily)